MSRKVLRGHTTLWAVRPEAFTLDEWKSEDGLSAAKWAIGVANGLITDFSCAAEDSYTLNTTGQTTSDSQSVCDIAQNETPRFITYEAEIDLFRNDPGTADPDFYDRALSLFDGLDTEYFLVKRVDKVQSSPVEEGDILSAYGVTVDRGQDVPDDNGDLMFTARFKPAIGVNLNKSVQA